MNALAKHTPGPWFAGKPGPMRHCNVYGPENTHIATANHLIGGHGPEWIDNPDMAIGEAEANARLIAAAPEMAEALRELLADKYLSDPVNADRMAKSRAALRKAGLLS